jgi:hypothetical protein
MTDLPIMCTLSPDALKARKDGLLARVAAMSIRTTKLAEGYRLEFSSESEALPVIAEMIDAERQCCRFLRFAVVLEANLGPVSLELTGPAGTRAFLEALLEPS